VSSALGFDHAVEVDLAVGQCRASRVAGGERLRQQRSLEQSQTVAIRRERRPDPTELTAGTSLGVGASRLGSADHVFRLALSGAATLLLQRNHHFEHQGPRALAFIGTVVSESDPEVRQAIPVRAFPLGSRDLDPRSACLNLRVASAHCIEKRRSF